MENSIKKSLPEPFTQKAFYGWVKKSYHLKDGKVYGVTTMKRYDKGISSIATVGHLQGRDVFVHEHGAEQIFGPKYLKKATEKNIVEIHDEFIERNFKPVFV